MCRQIWLLPILLIRTLKLNRLERKINIARPPDVKAMCFEPKQDFGPALISMVSTEANQKYALRKRALNIVPPFVLCCLYRKIKTGGILHMSTRSLRTILPTKPIEPRQEPKKNNEVKEQPSRVIHINKTELPLGTFPRSHWKKIMSFLESPNHISHGISTLL